MNFATIEEIEVLELDARNLGAKIKPDQHRPILEHIQFHEHFVIAGYDNRTKAEGVTTTKWGDFICVMVDTDDDNAVSFVRQNFNNFRSLPLDNMCETLEIVRKAYFQAISNTQVAA